MTNEIKNLMFDLASGREIFDAEQDRVISKAEANDVLRKYCFETLGLTEKSTDRDMQRAFKSEEGRKFFQVVEELVDIEVATGWQDNEFFQQFVESRSVADGDRTDFVTTEDIILTVAKVSGDQHDYTMQTLNQNKTFTVPMSTYAMKVGGDIRLFVTGRKDWGALVEAITKAFTKQIMDEMYAEFMGASASIPPTAQFNKTGTLGASTKASFDELIEDVSVANNNADVVILGTKTALKKINDLVVGGGVQWIADSQKESVAATGRLGDYEGTALIEIPQRFEKNNTAAKLVASDKLLILPRVDLKPVKLVDGGETTINVDGIGTLMDDFQTLEVTRKYGISTIITKYFGQWTIA